MDIEKETKGASVFRDGLFLLSSCARADSSIISSIISRFFEWFLRVYRVRPPRSMMMTVLSFFSSLPGLESLFNNGSSSLLFADYCVPFSFSRCGGYLSSWILCCMMECRRSDPFCYLCSPAFQLWKGTAKRKGRERVPQ